MRYAVLFSILALLGGLGLIIWAFRCWLDGLDEPVDPGLEAWVDLERAAQQDRHTEILE